ncbi:hypothetical protein NTE_03416 [Candidatus Nitrososphaera evergladensis SR1]|uniref:Uncharacterized protein n=1 Tax=Candidatus Nitrososphaera evergladensis SR1 TaxID=1459636 RepID=A0A075N1W3_9ARCH|nr:hypothetical protein [Candidatus Nitrososphaera evergladensis]AIF85444.1 hypothetical protein NTE_03416 [Candidatus Nitrososphaera evergladensis SR1]
MNQNIIAIAFIYGGKDIVKLLGVDHISHLVELADEEIKTIIAILRFSSDACPIESLSEQRIEYDVVKNLISKFEEVLK